MVFRFRHPHFVTIVPRDVSILKETTDFLIVVEPVAELVGKVTVCSSRTVHLKGKVALSEWVITDIVCEAYSVRCATIVRLLPVLCELPFLSIYVREIASATPYLIVPTRCLDITGKPLFPSSLLRSTLLVESCLSISPLRRGDRWGG